MVTYNIHVFLYKYKVFPEPFLHSNPDPILKQVLVQTILAIWPRETLTDMYAWNSTPWFKLEDSMCLDHIVE
jgi:hypothetical protein